MPQSPALNQSKTVSSKKYVFNGIAWKINNNSSTYTSTASLPDPAQNKGKIAFVEETNKLVVSNGASWLGTPTLTAL